MRQWYFILSLWIILGISNSVRAQSFLRVSHGDDMFAIGGGARAMGMGGAQVALTDDVTAGFWNPAGLFGIDQRQLAYMHSERFGGIVSYDYGAFAAPLRNSDDVLAISFFRQGVDGIKNTLNAWDRERDRPVANPEDHITEFSSSDMAVMISYASHLGNYRNGSLSWGGSAKILYSKIGPFANGFGYSVDLGSQYRSSRFRLGINLQNITTLMKLWTVNEEKLEPLREYFGDETLNVAFPEGQNEYTLPSIRYGGAYWWDLQDFRVTLALDVVSHFEGRKTYNINTGPISFQPHFGSEIGYNELLFIRIGVTDIYTDKDSKLYVSPTLGAGIRVNRLFLDYGFGGFTGINASLGTSHRVSAKIEF